MTIRDIYNSKIHPMDQYDGAYDHQAENYVEWLEDMVHRLMDEEGLWGHGDKEIYYFIKQLDKERV